MNRKYLIFGIITVLLIGSWVLNELRRDKRVSQNIVNIVPGTPAARVLEVLGRPSSVQSCKSSYAVSAVLGCSRVFVYRGAFSPFLPAWESIYLDQSGMVITSEYYSSP
jgi:hypothetical protein